MRVGTGLFAVLLAAVLAWARPAGAVELDLKDLLQPPAVGAWSSYVVSGKSLDTTRRFYLAVVGREERGGVPHLWLELTTTVKDGGDSLTVMGLFPAGETMGLEARRVVVKLGGAAAQEVPSGLAGVGTMLASRFGLGIDLDELGASISRGAKEGVSATEEPDESLELVGGSLYARHLLVGDGQGGQVNLWLSRRVPLFGFVRAEHEEQTLELEDWGDSGAVTRIGTDFREFDLKKMFNQLLKK